MHVILPQTGHGAARLVKEEWIQGPPSESVPWNKKNKGIAVPKDVQSKFWAAAAACEDKNENKMIIHPRVVNYYGLETGIASHQKN